VIIESLFIRAALTRIEQVIDGSRGGNLPLSSLQSLAEAADDLRAALAWIRESHESPVTSHQSHV